MWVPNKWVAPAALTAAAVVAIGGGYYLLSGDSGSVTTASGRPVAAVDAALGGCAVPPGPVQAGAQAFAITNRSSRSLEIALAAPDGTVLAELEALAPTSTRTMPVALGAGTYHFECYFNEVHGVPGPAFDVHGDAAPGPAVKPLSTQDLTPVTLAYQRWVAGQLPGLRADVGALAAAPDVATAQRAWRTAHDRYETLGAAYDAFGDWDARINGPDTGFHQVEAALWGSPATVPAAAEHDLVTAVDGLVADFPNLAIDPLQIGLRAHEITENTIEFTLAGTDDHGSHTALATAAANLQGTRRLLDLLTPLLADRYADLPRTRTALDRADAVTRDLAARFGDRPLTELPTPDRERLNAAFSGLAERLAPIAAIADVRRTS